MVALRGLLGPTMFLARLDAQQQALVRGNINIMLAEQEEAGRRPMLPAGSGHMPQAAAPFARV